MEQGQGPEERRLAISAISTRRITSTASPPASRTKSNKLGFVAAKPIASVLSQHQFVLLGARSTNPKAIVQVIFTGDWSMPVREAEAANALVDAGCDVITCHVDGPKVVIETAEKRGVDELRPQREPGAARAQGLHHRRRIQVGDDLQGLRRRPRRRQDAAEFPRRRLRGRLRPATRRSAPAATPEAQKAALAAIEGLKAKKPIYVGPLKDNKTGKVVIDKTYDNLDPYLDKMDYLLEGVIGSTT